MRAYGWRLWWKIALASTWAGAKADKRKAGLVAVAAAMVTVLFCGAVGSWLMNDRVANRARARAFVAADPGARVALSRSSIFDETLDGSQVYIYWWRYESPSARIPGVPGQPGAGTWFVSPALLQRMQRDHSLAKRFPSARRIANSGVGSADELVAYKIVRAGIPMQEMLTDDAEPVDWIGVGSDLEPVPLLIAGCALLVAPAIGLLVAAVAPLSGALATRRQLLSALGASRRQVLVLTGLQGAMSALPGCVGGAIIWAVVSPTLQSVPFVGRTVLLGDLATPWYAAAGVGIGVATLVFALSIRRTGRSARSRPSEAEVTAPSLARSLPLAMGIVAMAIGVGRGGASGTETFLAGVLLTAIGAAIALPIAFDRLGSKLAGTGDWRLLLVGRRLSAGATSAGRGLVALGSLAILVPVLAAWYAVATAQDPPNDRNPQIVELSGPVSTREIDALAAATQAVPVAVAFNQARSQPFLVANCVELQGQAPSVDCGPDGFETPASSYRTFGPYQGLRGGPEVPNGYSVESVLFVGADWVSVDNDLRAWVANGDRADLAVDTPARVELRRSSLTQWLAGAVGVLGALAGVALTLGMVAFASRFARSRTRLVALGVSDRDVARIAAIEVGLVVVTVGLAGSALGLVCSAMFTALDPAARLPLEVSAVSVALAVVIAGVSGLAAYAAVTGELKSLNAGERGERRLVELSPQ